MGRGALPLQHFVVAVTRQPEAGAAAGTAAGAAAGAAVVAAAGMAGPAVQMGGWVARDILARVQGQSHAPFRWLDFGSMAVIGRWYAVADLRGLRLHAVAGIGEPARFFDHLRALGLEFVAHPFPDHHRFVAADLDFGEALPILMTAKDAVKCAAFAPDDCWEYPVRAQIGSGAAERILEKLEDGRTSA